MGDKDSKLIFEAYRNRLNEKYIPNQTEKISDFQIFLNDFSADPAKYLQYLKYPASITNPSLIAPEIMNGVKAVWSWWKSGETSRERSQLEKYANGYLNDAKNEIQRIINTAKAYQGQGNLSDESAIHMDEATQNVEKNIKQLYALKTAYENLIVKSRERVSAGQEDPNKPTSKEQAEGKDDPNIDAYLQDFENFLVEKKIVPKKITFTSGENIENIVPVLANYINLHLENKEVKSSQSVDYSDIKF